MVLGTVIERAFIEMKTASGAKAMAPEQAHGLLRDTFWLLAAKILHDKEVEGFKTLRMQDVDNVFERVRRHYGDPVQLRQPLSKKEARALETAAEVISGAGHLGQVTTESLAYVYEETLVSPQLRAQWGIHSTPTYLVDYIVNRISGWVDEMDPYLFRIHGLC